MKKTLLLSLFVLAGLFSGCSVAGDPADLTDQNASAVDVQTVPGPLLSFDTAFAHGNYIFSTDPASNPEFLPSLELTKDRWGWALNIVPKGVTTNLIYYGAGLNNIQNGVLVGTLIVYKYCDKAKFKVNLFPQFRLKEINIYAGDQRPATIAPGLFGFTRLFSPLRTAYSVVLPVVDTDGDGIWIIVHAVVGVPQ